MLNSTGLTVCANEYMPESSDADFHEETIVNGTEESSHEDESLPEDADQVTEERAADLSAEETDEGESTGELIDENRPAEGILGATPDENEITTWTQLQTAFEVGGTINLTQNITADEGAGALVVPSGKTVILDLKGCTISRGLVNPTADGYVIQNDGTLTITDSSAGQSGKITGGYNDEYEDDGIIPFGFNRGGGIYNNGALTLDGGSITGNKAKDNAGVFNYGTFTMNGGEISSNTSYLLGGAGVTNYGTFTMTGGTISGNSAGNNGGGVCVRAGTATISGGTITGNSATGTTAGDANTTVKGCGSGVWRIRLKRFGG